MSTDAELLQRYVGQHDERAFAELVQRHLGLVYATASRGVGGRTHLAEEITQKVFIQLARKSALLLHHPTLTGWLYLSTRYASRELSRSELRRQRVNQSLATMPNTTSENDMSADWEQLRPVLDEAMEALKELDRKLMLLRFFQGLTFVEAGEKLGLSENAARMRTERALDKLRGHLGKRGVTSTTAALGLLLTNHAFAQTPAGLATSITSAALAATPLGVTATLITSLAFKKFAVAVSAAACSTGITLLACTSFNGDRSENEFVSLWAENARLKAISGVGTPRATVAAVAQGTTEQTTKRLQGNHSSGSSVYRNHGQATPYDAFLTYVWAIDSGESDVLENILTYDDKGREGIRVLYASLPAAIRASHPTPEKFVAFLYIADTILRPLKGKDLVDNYTVTEIEPGLAAVHRKDAKRGGMKWVRTDEVWKMVVPSDYPELLAQRILGNEILVKLGVK